MWKSLTQTAPKVSSKIIPIDSCVVYSSFPMFFSFSLLFYAIQNSTLPISPFKFSLPTLPEISHYHSNRGGCLKSLNTSSSWWRPFKWDIWFVGLKLDAFFPPLGILAEHALQIAMALSSSATEKNFQTAKTCSQMMTLWAAESHCNLKQVTCTRKEDESQINQTDWLISQQVHFIGSKYRISFIYWSNKNDVIFTHIGR